MWMLFCTNLHERICVLLEKKSERRCGVCICGQGLCLENCSSSSVCRHTLALLLSTACGCTCSDLLIIARESSWALILWWVSWLQCVFIWDLCRSAFSWSGLFPRFSSQVVLGVELATVLSTMRRSWLAGQQMIQTSILRVRFVAISSYPFWMLKSEIWDDLEGNSMPHFPFRLRGLFPKIPLFWKCLWFTF